MRKQLDPGKIAEVLRRLFLIFSFVELTPADLTRAAELQWDDFEDAVLPLSFWRGFEGKSAYLSLLKTAGGQKTYLSSRCRTSVVHPRHFQFCVVIVSYTPEFSISKAKQKP